jgi:hypothetical protein
MLRVVAWLINSALTDVGKNLGKDRFNNAQKS